MPAFKVVDGPGIEPDEALLATAASVHQHTARCDYGPARFGGAVCF